MTKEEKVKKDSRITAYPIWKRCTRTNVQTNPEKDCMPQSYGTTCHQFHIAPYTDGYCGWKKRE